MIFKRSIITVSTDNSNSYNFLIHNIFNSLKTLFVKTVHLYYIVKSKYVIKIIFIKCTVPYK